MLNREQRRRLQQLPQEKKIKLLSALMAVQAATPDETPGGLKQGDKVKLNYTNLKADKDYNKLVQARKDFIEAYKDRIFTVEFDKDKTEKPVVVCLAEDTTEPKWFWTDQQLTKSEENENTEHEDH